MGKHQSSMRQVPWQSWAHWEWVATGLFSDSPERISAALSRITAWQSRGNVPISVESTAALIGIHQRDPHFNYGVQQQSALPEGLLQMMYAMAIQRLVNGVVDPSHKRKTSSVADRADVAGLPRLLVDIRHEAAHTELPAISLLRVASKEALAWLKVQYWDQQRETLVNARVMLKSKLVEHCLLVVDILSPSTPGTGLQKCKDGQEANDDFVKKSQETLTVMKQKRMLLFNELLVLSLSSASDLISILVDDGLLEQNKLSNPDDLGNKHEIMDESMASLAWKFTLRKLFSHLPRLPGMLLVAIVKRLNPCCARDGGSCRTDEEGSTRSFIKSSKTMSGTRETVVVDTIRRNRLIFWCSWFLGKGAPQGLDCSGEQERPKSKLLRLSDTLSVRVDISRGLLGELLRMSLCASGSGPLVELVSLFSSHVGTKNFQHRATALAELGTSMQRVQGKVIDRPKNQETGSTTLPEEELMHEGSLEDRTTTVEVGPYHTATLDQGYSGRPDDLSSVLSDSALEIARRQQATFFARFSLQKNVSSTDDHLPCSKETITESTVGLEKSAALTSYICSQQVPTLGPIGGVNGIGRWTVVEKWQSCAIGMIPSPCYSTGTMSFLELQESVAGEQLVVHKHHPGSLVSKEYTMDAGVRHPDKDGLPMAYSVEPVVSKRKNDENSGAGLKRIKEAVCHVQFNDSSPLDPAEKVVASPDWEPLSLNQERSPENEVGNLGSSMQGCLLQHGVLMRITPEQVKSLQSAIHVL